MKKIDEEFELDTRDECFDKSKEEESENDESVEELECEQ